VDCFSFVQLGTYGAMYHRSNQKILHHGTGKLEECTETEGNYRLSPKKGMYNLDAHNSHINRDTIIVFCSDGLE
jgi:hypothetical protein